MTTQAQKVGQYYEKQACDLLIASGYRILATNWLMAGVGELDIVAYHDTIQEGGCATLVCVEVKARRKSRFSSAIETVSLAKQKKLIHTMQYFLQSHERYAKADVRFDVVAFDIMSDGQAEVVWVKGAFLTDG